MTGRNSSMLLAKNQRIQHGNCDPDITQVYAQLTSQEQATFNPIDVVGGWQDGQYVHTYIPKTGQLRQFCEIYLSSHQYYIGSRADTPEPELADFQEPSELDGTDENEKIDNQIQFIKYDEDCDYCWPPLEVPNSCHGDRETESQVKYYNFQLI
uniref:Uncharacterized protein LOC100376796 n=1 Tax=Saccoglossus kowalevskii TaxID=10224 RepID=A0ABM0MVH4_SACKO|nr:PREDICTED: uncharacterized protein LOC100376796 [Saccoglossus kowalevskii]